MKLTRRAALTAAAAATFGATTLGKAVKASAAVPAYSWRLALENGGRGNAVAFVGDAEGHAVLMGDVWGIRESVDAGNSWYPRNNGVSNGIMGVYGRAVAASVANPGTAYVGVGPLKTSGGYFKAIVPGSGLVPRSSLGFSDNLSGKPAATMPRSGCGNLIAVVPDSTYGERIFALIHTGLYTSVNGGKNFSLLSGAVGGHSQKLVLPMGAKLLTASYKTSSTGGSIAHLVDPASGAASAVSGAPGVINDGVYVNGYAILAAGLGGLVKFDGKSFSKVFSATGVSFSSVAGVGNTLYATVDTAPKNSAKHVAKSVDGGLTWKWVTTKSNIIMRSFGSAQPYPLAFAQNSLGKNGFKANQIAVDPLNPNNVLIAGTGGVWGSHNGGSTWQPAGVGAAGGETSHIRVNADGSLTIDDVDWHGWTSKDKFQTYTRVSSPGTFPASALSRTTPLGKLVVNAKNESITLGGADISDPLYRSAAFKPTDVVYLSDGTIIVSLYGGNVLVGSAQ